MWRHGCGLYFLGQGCPRMGGFAGLSVTSALRSARRLDCSAPSFWSHHGRANRADPGEKRDTAKGINHQRVDSQKELDLNMPNKEDNPIYNRCISSKSPLIPLKILESPLSAQVRTLDQAWHKLDLAVLFDRVSEQRCDIVVSGQGFNYHLSGHGFPDTSFDMGMLRADFGLTGDRFR